MAKSQQYSCSVFGASDEVPDIYCEPCRNVGHITIAEGYCVNCPEYLCGPCYKIHRQHKALANHVLLGKDSMPLTTDSRCRVVDVCEAKCPIHPNKVIELFCVACDKLVCTICVAIDHRQCEEVKHIPDIANDLKHTEEVQKFYDDIKSTANALSEHEKKLQANVTSSGEMRKLAKQELNHWRAEVNRFFDQLEKKMDVQITSIEKRNRGTLKAASHSLNHIKKDLDRIKNDVETKSKEQRCELFIAMKQNQEKLMNFQDQLAIIQRELRIQHYTLLPSEQIQDMMRTTTEICRIETARFESMIDIKTNRDKNKPLIFGLTIMHGHYCVASDYKNKSVKVIDTNSKCVTSEITIEAEKIWTGTSVSDDQFAVSVSLSRCKHQIQFFTVSASGVIQRISKLYDADAGYIGMVYCSGNIYGLNHKRIDRLDITGKIKRTIHTDDKGLMARIAVSPNGQTLYVTDSMEHSVTSMTLDGKVKTVFKDKDLKNPGGITVDKHGYVYVCSRGTRNIQLLTEKLSMVQVLIDESCDTLTYSSTDNKLYISLNGNPIHQYSLDFKINKQTFMNKQTSV